MNRALEACTSCYFVVKSHKSTISHSHVSFNGWMNVTSDPALLKRAHSCHWMDSRWQEGAEISAVSPPVLPSSYPSVSFTDYRQVSWFGRLQINLFSGQFLARGAESMHDDSVESLSVWHQQTHKKNDALSPTLDPMTPYDTGHPGTAHPSRTTTAAKFETDALIYMTYQGLYAQGQAGKFKFTKTLLKELQEHKMENRLKVQHTTIHPDATF